MVQPDLKQQSTENSEAGSSLKSSSLGTEHIYALSELETSDVASVDFVLRALYENNNVAFFLKALEKRIRQYDREIEKLCNFHYHDFVKSVEELVTLRQDCQELKNALAASSGYLSDCTRSLASVASEIIRQRKLQRNIVAAVDSVSMCLPVLEKFARLNELLNQKKYYPALRTLEQLEHTYLPRVARYRFGDAIVSSIKGIRQQIKTASFNEFTDFLENIRNVSGKIGAVALRHTVEHLKQSDVEEKFGSSRKFEKIDRRDFYNFLFALICHIHGFQDPLHLNVGCWPVITRKDEMQFLIFSNKWLADCQKALPNIFIWNCIPSVLCETTSPFFMDILLRISTIALLKCTWETYGNICIFPIKANEALDWLAMAEKQSTMQQSLLTELKTMEFKKKTAEDHIQRIEEVERDIAKLAELVKTSVVNDESCLKLNLPTLKAKNVKEIADHVLYQFSSALREREIYLESLKKLADCLLKLEARISNGKHDGIILPLDGLSKCFREKVTDSNGRFNLDNFFAESVKAIVSDPFLDAEFFQNAYLNLKEGCTASNARAARLKAVKDVLLKEIEKFPVLKEKLAVHSLITEQRASDLSSDVFTKALFSLNEKPNTFDFQHDYSFSNDSNLTSISSLLQLDISDITVHVKGIGHI